MLIVNEQVLVKTVDSYMIFYDIYIPPGMDSP
jgi:hypothetical protein